MRVEAISEGEQAGKRYSEFEVPVWAYLEVLGLS
jgi:hypothetical protein